MPPPLALLLCTVFVLVLLRTERRMSAGVSKAMWIPTVWMLLIASKPLGIWFGTSGDAEAGSPLDRLVLSGLGLAGVVVLARRHFDAACALRENKWLVVLLGYMLVSTLWSDITFIAFKRWIRDAIVVIMALVILSESNPRLGLESVLRRAIYVLIPFSIVLIKYYPALGVDYGRWSGLQMWIGMTVHKNTLGRLCLVAAFFLLWTLYQRWRRRDGVVDRHQIFGDVWVLAVAVYLLKGAENAYSATSIATFAVGTVTLLGLAWLRRQQLQLPKTGLLTLVVFLIGFGVSAPFVGGSNVAVFSSALGRNETLTGRTDTWVELVPVVQRQPLLGVGFGSFWTTDRRTFYEMSHGHNGYLDILLELGVVGLAFYVVFLLSCANRLHEALSEHYDWASFGICLLVMTLLYNVSESALNSFAEQMTAVVLLASLAVFSRKAVAPAGYSCDLSSSFTSGSPVR